MFGKLFGQRGFAGANVAGYRDVFDGAQICKWLLG